MNLQFRDWLSEYAGEPPTQSLSQATTEPASGTAPTLAASSGGTTLGGGIYRGPKTIADNDYKNHYVHPDLIWKSQPETTFFFSKSGNLWTFPGTVTHQQALIGKKVNEDSQRTIDTLPDSPSTSQAFAMRPGSQSWEQPPNRDAFRDIFGPQADLRVLQHRDFFTNAALLGRAGGYDGKKYVTFWNSPESLVRRMMIPCLQDLKGKGLVNDGYIVSHPSVKDVTVGSVLKDGLTSLANDPAAEEWARKARELHLMPSDQKGKARKELGLANTAPSPNTAYQRAMQKAGVGFHAPWRGTSEQEMKPLVLPDV